jgi:phosphate:Na+ symporter
MGLIGFGFVFYGMELMDQAVEPLKNSEFLSQGLSWVQKSFWLGLMSGTVCTLIIQSSAATIVFVMSLVSQGLISPQDSVAIVLGANLATCDSAILASLTRGSKAWRLALGYLLIRIVSIVSIYFVLPWFQELIRILTNFLAGSMDPARYVANTHTFFNILASFALLPFTGLIEKIVQFVIPTRRRPEIFDFRKEGLLAAKKAIIDMTRRVAQMMTMIVKAFRDNDLKALRKVLDADEEIDLINWQMKQGLMARERKDGESDGETIKFLWVAAQLEHIGDVLSKDAVELARKKIYEGLEFSDEGEAELENFYGIVYNLFEKAFSAFVQGNQVAAKEVLSECEEVKKMKWQMHISHLRRFGKGIQETLNTSSIHMDLITDLERICDHSASVVKEVLN